MVKKVFASSLGNIVTIDGPLADVSDPLSLLELVVSVIIGVMTVLGGLYFIFMFLTGAYEWINAAGDKNRLQKAQARIIHAIIGLVILVAAWAIISLFGYVLGFSILNPADQLGTIWD